MYLNSINTYRGISIILIVAAHCYSISEIKIDSIAEGVYANLIAGSTIHFVFISGFLFHHIFYLKNKTGSFYNNKVKRLLIPYTILSIAPIFLKLQTQPEFWGSYISPNESSILSERIISSLLYYFSGAHLIAYWYIPFAMCLFLMYPLHLRFIEMKPKNQIIAVVLLYAIALLVHRPINPLGIPQSILYFTPCYLFGILCSIHKEFIFKKFKKKTYWFLIIAIAIAYAQAVMGKYNNSAKALFVYDGIDLVLLQKIFLCLFFMLFLHQHENVKTKLLGLLASTSFAIYFIHGYILQSMLQFKLAMEIQVTYPWLCYFFVLFVLVFGSMTVALIVKKIWPEYSKYITGY